MWYQMFVQAVKVKGLFALICPALWSRVEAGEGQLPWRWAVVGRPWGLSSEQTALYKSSMWPTTWNSPIFVSEKAGTLCTEDQSSHNVLLGRSLVQIGSLSLFEPLKAEGCYGSRTGSTAEDLCEVWREGVIFRTSVQEKWQVWAQKLEQAIQKLPDNWWR